MKLIEIVNKIDVKKINVKKDEVHKLEDIQILKIEEERRKMAKNSLLFLLSSKYSLYFLKMSLSYFSNI